MINWFIEVILENMWGGELCCFCFFIVIVVGMIYRSLNMFLEYGSFLRVVV